MYVNKVGPYFNPQETYHYYTLPVCVPEKVCLFIPTYVPLYLSCTISQIEHRSLTLGEVLDGDRMAVSLYEIGFKESFNRRVLCTKTMSETELDFIKEAVEDLYYFEFIYGE